MATYDREHDGYRVFVGGISPRITKEELKHEFDRYGRINDVWVARNPPGFGFIVYKHSDDAEKAVRRMDKKRSMGSILRVEHANQPYRGSLGGRSRRDRSRSPPRKVARRSRSRSKHRHSRSRDRDNKKYSSRSRSLSGKNERSKKSKRDNSRSGSDRRKSSDKGRSSRRERSSEEERLSRSINNKTTSRSPSNNGGAGDRSRGRSHDDEIVNNGKIVNQSTNNDDVNSIKSSREHSPVDKNIRDNERSPSHEREEGEEIDDDHHRSPPSRHEEDDDDDSPRQSRGNSLGKRDDRSESGSRRSASPVDNDSRSE